VYYIEGKAVGTKKTEKIYYIMYRKDGKQIHEKAGRQYQDDMTPARASGIRSDRIQGKEPSNREKRESEHKAKDAEKGKWTIDRLAKEYFNSRTKNKSRNVDKGRYKKYLKAPFGKKEPYEILALDIQRFRKNLKRKPSKKTNPDRPKKLPKKLSPQTEKHLLNLFTWIVNYGVKNNLCQGLSFHIKKPTVSNEKTEDLTKDQLNSLLKAIDGGSNLQVANLMRMALYTGMRRGVSSGSRK